jgi:hypothetical protein
MPDGILRLLLGGVLFLHGIAHGGGENQDDFRDSNLKGT